MHTHTTANVLSKAIYKHKCSTSTRLNGLLACYSTITNFQVFFPLRAGGFLQFVRLYTNIVLVYVCIALIVVNWIVHLDTMVLRAPRMETLHTNATVSLSLYIMMNIYQYLTCRMWTIFGFVVAKKNERGFNRGFESPLLHAAMQCVFLSISISEAPRF